MSCNKDWLHVKIVDGFVLSVQINSFSSARNFIFCILDTMKTLISPSDCCQGARGQGCNRSSFWLRKGRNSINKKKQFAYNGKNVIVIMKNNRFVLPKDKMRKRYNFLIICLIVFINCNKGCESSINGSQNEQLLDFIRYMMDLNGVMVESKYLSKLSFPNIFRIACNCNIE